MSQNLWVQIENKHFGKKIETDPTIRLLVSAVLPKNICFYSAWYFSLYFFIVLEVLSVGTHTHAKQEGLSVTLPSHKLAHPSSSWDQLQWSRQSLSRLPIHKPRKTWGHVGLFNSAVRLRRDLTSTFGRWDVEKRLRGRKVWHTFYFEIIFLGMGVSLIPVFL